MIIRFVLISLCFLCFAQTHAQANQALSDVLSQVEKGNSSIAINSRAQFQGNARHTIDWYLYAKGSPNISFEEVAGFLIKFPNWPYSITIQERAEENLGGALSPQAYNFFNTKPPITAKGMGLYLQTLNSKGQQAKAKQVLNKWWVKADLSRQEQQQIFSRHSQQIDRAVSIQRLHHLLDERQYDNAQGLAQAVGSVYVGLASARQALGQNRGDVNAKIAAVSNELSGDVGLQFDRLQWRRKKDINQGAIELLNKAPPASQMRQPASWWRERHIITRRLMEQKQYREAYRLASTHRQKTGFPRLQAEWLSGFLALRFTNQPYKAFEHFETIYKSASSPISKARGAYWAGRASEDLKSPDIAQKWYAVGAKYSETFYGQLAAEKLGRIVQVNMNKASNENTKLNNPLANVAVHLSNAGLKKETDAFLLRLMDHAASASELEAIAHLATRLKRENVAIKVAQTLQKKHNIVLGAYLYPQKVQELSNIRGVEWAFINAIIRQESRFDAEAVSHAGARGLMQLMPATAKETASSLGLSHQRGWLTTRPSHNIKLGSGYLQKMVARYDGNYAMAAAAYNAGPGRVDRWIKEIGDPRTGQIDFLDWAEQIPIYETRNYVQRVLEAVYLYRQRLKGHQPNIGQPIHVALSK